MIESKKDASRASDQPAHEALKPVELAGMDLMAIVRPSHPENAELRIRAINVRDSTMDEYGVGYTFEIAQGKSWKKASLSRRNFGIDNFSVEMTALQYMNVKAEGNEIPAGSNIQIGARLWHWKGDEALAKKALLDALDSAIKSHVQTLGPIKEKAAEERLEALPLPAESPAQKKPPRP